MKSLSVRQRVLGRKRDPETKEAGMAEAIDVSERISHLPFVGALVTAIFLFLADDDRYSDRDRDGRHGRRDQRDRRDDRRDDRAQASSNSKNIPTGPRANRDKAPPTGPSSSMPPPSSIKNVDDPLAEASSNYVPQMNDNDLSAIRSRYLGVDKKKRKIRKMNDRKFVFDWDVQDDTLTEDSPYAMGAKRQGAQVMFGYGHLAGMDDGGGVRKSGSKGDPKYSDAMERRKASKAGIDERHWSEKPLSEMKDRDWRIFREDFSIAARGTSMSFRQLLTFLIVCLCRWSDSSSTPFLGRVHNS